MAVAERGRGKIRGFFGAGVVIRSSSDGVPYLQKAADLGFSQTNSYLQMIRDLRELEAKK